MAQTDGHLTFDTKINVDGFNEGTEKIVNSLSKIGEQLKKLAESAVSVGNDFTTSLKKMKDSSKEASEQSEKLAKNTKEYKEAVKDAGEETQKTAKSMSLLDFAGVQVFSNLATQAITKLGSKLKNLATSVLSTGIGFESSMSEVAAISGATDEELEKLTATAKEYGAATKFTAEESAQAFKYMALARWDATQMTEALPGVLNLAASAGMDLAQASDIVTDYISAFGMETKEATYLADLLSYAQSNSNTSVEQLSEAYKNCAASMHSTGQSVETTTALLSSMANQGFKGAEAGTALTATMRDITDKMYKVTDETIKANEELKGTDEYISNLRDSYGKYVVDIGNAAVAVSDEAGNYKQLIDIMKDVEKVTGSMTEAERASELQSTFTRYSIKGVNMILTEGADSAAAFATELENSAGTAAKAAETMQDNVQGDLTKLSSAFDGLKLSVFEELKEPIRDVLQTLTKTLSDSRVQKGATELGETLGEMAKTLASKLPSVISSISDVVKFLWGNKGLIAGFASAFATSKIISFAGKVTKAISGIGTALKGNPVGAILTGLQLAAGVAGTIIAKSKEWKNHLKQVEEEASEIPKQFQSAQEKTKECAESWEELRKSMSEKGGTDNVAYEEAKKIKDKILECVEADGKIKDGQETTVTNLLGKLNEYADTSLTVSNGIIQNNDGIAQSYEDISASIDKAIEKQHAQTQLEILQETYVESEKEKKTASKSYSDSQQGLQRAEKSLQNLQSEYDKLYNETHHLETDANGKTYEILNTSASKDKLKRLEELQAEIDGTKTQITTYRNTMSENKKLLQEYKIAGDEYKQGLEEWSKGNYEKLGELVSSSNAYLYSANEADLITIFKQMEDASQELSNKKELFKSGCITEEDVNTQKQILEKAVDEYTVKMREGGASSLSAFLNAQQVQAISDAGKIDETIDFIETRLKSGLSTEQIKNEIGTQITSGLCLGLNEGNTSIEKAVQELIDKGCLTAQDAKKVLWEIQKQLENGTDLETACSDYGELLGKLLLDGMDLGIAMNVSKVCTTMANGVLSIINSANSAAEIRSPSRVMMRMGGYLDKGLEIGIEKNAPSVINTSTEMMNSILNTAKKLSNKDFLSNQGLNLNVNTLQSSESVPDIFTNNFISRFRAIQQIPTEQIQRLVNATNNMANMQGLNSVAPYSSVYNNVYNNYSETKTDKSQNITIPSNQQSFGNITIPLYVGNEYLDTFVLNTITRENAATGGFAL